MRITNEIIKELLTLERKLKELNSRREEIRDSIKKSGSTITAEFIVTVSESRRECMKSISDCIEVIGSKQALYKLGLIKEIKVELLNIVHKESK